MQCRSFCNLPIVEITILVRAHLFKGNTFRDREVAIPMLRLRLFHSLPRLPYPENTRHPSSFLLWKLAEIPWTGPVNLRSKVRKNTTRPIGAIFGIRLTLGRLS